MFRLDLLTNIGPLEIIDSLYTPDIAVEFWTKRINAPGPMAFSMRATHPKATETNLRAWRRVRLYRKNPNAPGYSKIWFGYIEDKFELDGRLEVKCNGGLGIFAKRYTTENQSLNGGGSSDVFSLLSAANTEQDTGITQGTGGVLATSDLTMQGFTDMLKAIELKAQSVGAEYEVDDEGALNFVSSLGSDKSGSIHLYYYRTGKPGTDLNAIRIGEKGKDMANRVIGKTSAGHSYQYDNASSQSTYGLLIEHKTFNEAQDLATVTEMTTNYGTQRSLPAPDFQVIPSMAKKRFNIRSGQRSFSGLGYGDVSVGDLITVTVESENRNQTTAKRIAELTVNVDENGLETMSLTLSEAGVYITAAYLDASRIADLNRRVKQIEATL